MFSSKRKSSAASLTSRRAPASGVGKITCLHLIAGNDQRHIAGRTGLPVFGLSGWLDPIVPWPWVRRWLRKRCPTLRDYQVLRGADHNVLSTAPQPAAEQVLRWMNNS